MNSLCLCSNSTQATGGAPPTSNDPYRGYVGGPNPYPPQARSYSQQPPPNATQSPSASNSTAQTTPTPGSYPPQQNQQSQQDYYRQQEQVMFDFFD